VGPQHQHLPHHRHHHRHRHAPHHTAPPPGPTLRKT
jgi:hypothetical protein